MIYGDTAKKEMIKYVEHTLKRPRQTLIFPFFNPFPLFLFVASF